MKIKKLRDMSKVSDGYHTFGELYDHRSLLFIAWMVSDGAPGRCYWVKDHYPDWDLLLCELRDGYQTQEQPYLKKQISYHVHNKFRHLYEKKIPERTKQNHTWDGHTSADVLKLIEDWITK